MARSELDVLSERLGRFPSARYPVQHATTQFHLGSVLLNTDAPVPAQAALIVARDLFARAGMRLEAAKATMMLGVALRTARLPDEAAATFTDAGAAFAMLGQVAEQAAASYNLGLACQDRGDAAAAREAWAAARDQFLAAGLPARAAAATRDHGGLLLMAGAAEAAVGLLTEAVDLAQRADDLPGEGAAANTLGLAHLAAADPDAAVTALRSALGCFPRSVRPADHAMVKANLALAYERAGHQDRARLAAGQALALDSAAASVRDQARQVLARQPGAAHGALLAVLDEAPPQQWGPLIRDEVLCLADAPVAERDGQVSGLLDGLLARPGTCYDLAESLLGVVLELPPGDYTLMVQSLVAGTGGRVDSDATRLRAILGSAMARFALPQWQRLAASLNAAAERLGEPTSWR